MIWGNRLFVSSEANAALRNKAGRPYGIQGDIKSLGDEPGHNFRLYCLDKRTGKILWERVAYEGAPKIKRHPKATHANASPATDGEHIVAFFGSEGLYCYDFDGKLVWKKDLGVIKAAFVLSGDEWSAASSPIIYRRLVIVQCDGLSDSFIAAYDIKDGREVWKTRRDEITSWATPSVHDAQPRVELITNASNYIRGYDPQTGRELWKLSGSSRIATPTPIIADGLIYVTNGYVIPGIQPIYAIRPGASGDISLKEDTTANEFIAWSVKKGGSYIPTPLIYQGVLYLLDDNGILVFYDAKTGKQLDKVRAGDTGSVFSASPLRGGGQEPGVASRRHAGLQAGLGAFAGDSARGGERFSRKLRGFTVSDRSHFACVHQRAPDFGAAFLIEFISVVYIHCPRRRPEKPGVTGDTQPPHFHTRCGKPPPRRSDLHTIRESVVAKKGVGALNRR